MTAFFSWPLIGVIPARALGVPRIVEIKPPSPQPVGICITVIAEVPWSSDFGMMRIRFGNEEWQEEATTEIKRTFCTNKYQPAIYKIRVEAAESGDNDWSHPTVAEADYELKDISYFYPGQVAIFGTLRQVFPARIGQDLYIIHLIERQRWLVPNRETGQAICIVGWDKPGNIWNAPDNELLKLPRGPDVPDINTDPDAFWEFRNKYFLPCDPSAFIQTVATPTVGPNSQGIDKGLIAFVRNSNIFMISPDGTGERQLTSDGGYSYPAWSPDGSTMAFVRLKDIDQSGGQATYIGLLDVFTLKEQILVEPGVSPFSPPPPWPPSYYIYDRPKWSPDGQSIYFHTFDGRASGDRIWKVDLGGSILTQDVFSNNRENDIVPFDVSPTDGKIVYVSLWHAPPDRGNGLSLTDENGNLLDEILPVSSNTYIDHLCWSWNGQRVNYTTSVDPTFGGRDNISWIDAIKTDDRGIWLDLSQKPQGLACSPYNDDFVYVIDETLIIFNKDAGTTLNLTQGIQPSWGRAILNSISDTISGQIIDFNTNNAIPDVSVSDDQGHITQTDMDGNFTISNLSPGTYTIKPQKSGFIFSPSSRTITIPPNASEQDFTGSGDLDGDGLYDIWEVKGYDANGDGTIDVDLPGMGADPNHKDLFVEVDYMVEKVCANNICFEHSHRPNPDAIAIVVRAFKDAPVNNIDGIHGINLHVDFGSDTPMNSTENWGNYSRSNPLEHSDEINLTDFYAIKGDRKNFDPVRWNIFHYAIFAHFLEGTVCASGQSPNAPAMDFVVTLGGWGGPPQLGGEVAPCFAPIRRYTSGTVSQQAGTFMHELGHNLGLLHGGQDNVAGKPNYFSVMNYAFQSRGLIIKGRDEPVFDFSRSDQIPVLDERQLDEGLGLNGGAATANYGTRWMCPNGKPKETQQSNLAIDWNCNGTSDEIVLNGNINNGWEDAPSPPDERLISYSDWGSNLTYVVYSTEINESGNQATSGTVFMQELSLEVDEQIPDPYDVGLFGYSGLVAPLGSTSSYTFTLANTGENEDIYILTATSSLGWANLTSIPDEVTLAPMETQDFSVSVEIPPTANKDDRDTIKIIARSTKNPTLWTSFYVTMTVAQVQDGQNSGMPWFLYVILTALMLIILGLTVPRYLQRKQVSSLTRRESQADRVEKYCRNCGTQLPKEGRFCPRCGAPRGKIQ